MEKNDVTTFEDARLHVGPGNIMDFTLNGRSNTMDYVKARITEDDCFEDAYINQGPMFAPRARISLSGYIRHDATNNYLVAQGKRELVRNHKACHVNVKA